MGDPAKTIPFTASFLFGTTTGACGNLVTVFEFMGSPIDSATVPISYDGVQD